MDTQTEIAELLLGRGAVGEDQLDEALSASQADLSGAEEEGIYLTSLARFVSALGGHLELQAVFPEDRVTVMRTDATAPTADRPDQQDDRSGGGSPMPL